MSDIMDAVLARTGDRIISEFIFFTVHLHTCTVSLIHRSHWPTAASRVVRQWTVTVFEISKRHERPWVVCTVCTLAVNR